jgi:DNA-binding transcriptional ArsR family regulator
MSETANAKAANAKPSNAKPASAALGALADPMRQDIVRLLAHEPRAVGEIAAVMPVSRPAISKHLKVLVAAGLVENRREGTRNIYALREAGISEVRSFLDALWTTALRRFALVAENTSTTPKRRSAPRSKGGRR